MYQRVAAKLTFSYQYIGEDRFYRTPGIGSYTYITLMHQSVVLEQLLRLSRVARLLWGLATLEYDRLVIVSSPIKNIDFCFGRPFPFPFLFPFPFPFPCFHVFQLPSWGEPERAVEYHIWMDNSRYTKWQL